MTDIARLGFSVDTNELDKGKKALNALKPAAENAAKASETLARNSKKTAGAVNNAAAGITNYGAKVDMAAAGTDRSSKAMLRASTSSNTLAAAMGGITTKVNVMTPSVDRTATAAVKATGAWGRFIDRLRSVSSASNSAKNGLDRLGTAANDNIGRLQATPGNIAAQFQDIGVTAAAGMSPMLVALQQGTQLSAAFAGGGLSQLGAAFKQIISPVSLATIGIVGLVVALIQMVDWTAVAKTALNGLADVLEEYAEAILYVGAVMLVAFSPQIIVAIYGVAKAIGIAFVNAVRAATAAMIGFALANPFTAIVLAIGAVIGIAALMGDKLTEILGFDIVDAAKKGVNFIIGTFVGAFNTIKKTWTILPEVIGAAAIGAANFALTAIKKLINGAIEGINGLIGMLPDFLGAGDNLITFRLDEGDTFDNPFADSLSNFLSIASGEMAAARNFDYVGAGMELGKGLLNSAGSSLRGFADGLGGEAEGEAKAGGREANSPKSEAEKFSDLTGSVERDIAMTEARIRALDLTAEAALRLENRAKLLNDAQAKGIDLTAAQAEELMGLADSLTNVQIRLRNAAGFKEITDGADDALLQLDQANDLIGMRGHELLRATYAQDLFNQALQKGIALDADQTQALLDRADALADAASRNEKNEFLDDIATDGEQFTRDLEQERKELFLHGAVLRSSQIAYDMLEEARRRNIDLLPEEVEAIRILAEEQGRAEEAINSTRQALDFARDTAAGFFQDMRDGLLEGKNVWEAFGDAAVNALDKIIERMTNELIDQFVNLIVGTASGSGGGEGGFFNSISKLFSAKGNSFTPTGVTAFANGGTFTDSVVDKVTPFAFGKGGSNLGIMGEAGPEAIMPLERGSDGSLGVQMFGGGGQSGPMSVNVDARSYHSVSGAVSSKDIIDLNKRSAAETEEKIKRKVVPWIRQFERDGAIS